MQKPIDREPHWLTRPATIRKLWWGLGVVLTLTVLAQFAIPIAGHFGLDRLFGFHAWYGFLACAAFILAAKAIGFLLKRPDTYYESRVEDEA